MDVLALIIVEVHDSSPNSVFSLLRTNRTLNEASQPFVLRKVTLNFDEKNLAEANDRITRWCEDPVAQRSIRFITVSEADWARRRYGSDPLPLEQVYLPLAKLLATLKGLKEFTFACHYPMPLALLDTLHAHQPTVHLHIKNWSRKSHDTPFGDPVELKLAESPILRSIHASHFHGQSGMNLQRPAFDRIVTLAPNIQSFHYESSHVGGCVIHLTPLEQWRQAALFQVQNPERKVVESVHLESSLSSSYLLNSQPLLDWSKLHTLTGVTIDKAFLTNPLDGSELTSLKCLSVNFGWSAPESSTYDNFFASLNPLESLSVIGGMKHLSLEMLLAHHGDSLCSFHIHEVESSRKEDRRQTLTPAQIDTIGHSCPKLESLGIEVDRTETREREARIYDLIHQMPFLTDITIYLDLGLPFINASWTRRKDANDVLSAVYPVLKPVDMEALWEAVGGKQSTKLQKLTVFVGEPNRSIGAGLPSPWVRREQRTRQRLVAVRSERDDKQNEIVLSGFHKSQHAISVSS